MSIATLQILNNTIAALTRRLDALTERIEALERASVAIPPPPNAAKPVLTLKRAGSL